MKHKFCVVTVLYKPTQEDISHLKNLEANDIPVIVWDNGNLGGVCYGMLNVYRDEEFRNVGLAAAYNKLIGISSAKGFEYVLILDQDTRLSVDLYDVDRALSKPISLLSENNDASGMFLLNNHSSTTQKRIFINSGLILKLDMFLPNFDEKLFVECVDYAWCLSADVRGRKILIYDRERLLVHHADEKIGKWGVRWRIYPLRRYAEFNVSIARLIFRSAFSKRFWFMKYFFKSWLSFNVKQFMSMVLKK
ncbi:hypothetical protein GN241_13060 [Rhodobacteraceae bacterium IMCC1335]